jgi:hypothetical protein
MRTERARLQGVLSRLRGTQESAAATHHAPTDPAGDKLRLILAWREQRIGALAAEAARLSEAIDALDGSAKDAVAAAHGGGQQGRHSIKANTEL